MKIVYMGTPDFSVGALEALIRAGHEITAVVTQPDRPRGRGTSGKQDQSMQYSPVKTCALAHGIPVFQPERIKRPEAVERLREFLADVYVVAAFGQLLSKEILEIPRLGCINIHASLLPRYRGASPIQQAVIDGEEKTGITIMQMNEGMDTGDILYQKEILIAPKETGASLFNKLAALGAEAIVEALLLLEEGKLKPVVQDESRATHVKMITKAQGRIDWRQSAEVIERLVRGMNAWPSAYTFWRGRQIKVWEAEVVRPGPGDAAGKPGEVIRVEQDAVMVMTGEGVLRILELQLEGKRRMKTRDFLLGYKIECGESFQE
ncbi:MAG: methionyl-tRNA formyltransferase [Lachnospiraceae bacterium]|nr:methionyl-tRNA formyltransferase [Lachnospiraceae bacterium]